LRRRRVWRCGAVSALLRRMSVQSQRRHLTVDHGNTAVPLTQMQLWLYFCCAMHCLQNIFTRTPQHAHLLIAPFSCYERGSVMQISLRSPQSCLASFASGGKCRRVVVRALIQAWLREEHRCSDAFVGTFGSNRQQRQHEQAERFVLAIRSVRSLIQRPNCHTTQSLRPPCTGVHHSPACCSVSLAFSRKHSRGSNHCSERLRKCT
jgi:hypothetical protein